MKIKTKKSNQPILYEMKSVFNGMAKNLSKQVMTSELFEKFKAKLIGLLRSVDVSSFSPADVEIYNNFLIDLQEWSDFYTANRRPTKLKQDIDRFLDFVAQLAQAKTVDVLQQLQKDFVDLVDYSKLIKDIVQQITPNNLQVKSRRLRLKKLLETWLSEYVNWLYRRDAAWKPTVIEIAENLRRSVSKVSRMLKEELPGEYADMVLENSKAILPVVGLFSTIFSKYMLEGR